MMIALLIGRSLLPLLAVLVILGCRSVDRRWAPVAGGTIVLQVHHDSPREGDSLIVRLVNATESHVGVEAYCGPRLFLESMNAAVPELRMLVIELDTCLGHLVFVEPGGARVLYAREQRLPPGRYRIGVRYLESPKAVGSYEEWNEVMSRMGLGLDVDMIYSLPFTVE